MNSWWIRLLSVGICLSLGCAEGLAPPVTTGTVEVRENLVFLFGTTQGCNEGVLQQCEPPLTLTIPTVKVQLQPFALDRNEVTNDQYRYCVAMGACTPPIWTSLTPTIPKYYGNPQYANHPVVWVSQAQAKEYCSFVDKRLPTEVEWERVAAGGYQTEMEKRVYSSMTFAQNISSCVGKSVAMFYCGVFDPAPVGASVDDFVIENGEMIYDMAGNVSEWTDTEYVERVTCKEALGDPDCDCWNCSSSNPECFDDCLSCPECHPADPSEPSPCYTMCSAVYGDIGLPICYPYEQEAALNQNSGPWPWSSGVGYAVVRGGNYGTYSTGTCIVRSTHRQNRPVGPLGISSNVGFRCAKTLDD
ncbi:MAG: hypothetical protein CMH54_12630 [Myxococcales bacterium]|nr:hypothetical protein [Myxococcales bacterium]|tara:strand:- start:260 stop:1336 length:1077 start_codon:yes stop_codon:yes gene_type:complete